LDLVGKYDIFWTVESCRGFKVFEINGYPSFSKVRSKTVKFGRNPGVWD
jgi:hypothetical protein